MKVCVGRIRKPHGTKGEVIIKTYTLSPSFFLCDYKRKIFCTENNIEIRLMKPRISKGNIIAKIDGYCDRTSVAELANKELFVDRESLPSLGDGEYYFEDLKNMKVIDFCQEEIGKVVAVGDYGAGVFLEIRVSPDRIATMPFNDKAILDVDQKNGIIIANKKMVLL